MRIETPHRELVIESRARVVGRAAGAAARRADPAVGGRRRARRARPARSAPIRRPSRSIRAGSSPLFDAATTYARESFPPRRPIYEAACELARRIKRRLRLRRQGDRGDDLAGRGVRARRGVCQDFAHVMIAALRGLGLPALYVSGYIRTIPPPGQAAPRRRRRFARLGRAVVRAGVRLARPRSDQRDCRSATITSSSRAAATIPTCRRSRA